MKLTKALADAEMTIKLKPAWEKVLLCVLYDSASVFVLFLILILIFLLILCSVLWDFGLGVVFIVMEWV